MGGICSVCKQVAAAATLDVGSLEMELEPGNK